MKLEEVACNNCGAPLEVAETAKYVTCQHCDTRLAITRTDHARFTESLDELRERTDQLSEQVESLTKQNDVEALDREWEQEKLNFMVTDKHGNTSLPTKTGSVIGGLVVAAFGTFWTIMAFSITSRSPFGAAKIFPLFGLIFIAFGVGMSVVSHKKAGEYERAYERYRRKRMELQERD